MSLSVTLYGKKRKKKCVCMECGNVHDTLEAEEYYRANITHILNKMAQEAGIYNELWRPDEHGITKAKQLIKPLEDGLEKLEASPEHYKKFNSPNGWGLYENFVPWVREYLEACKKYPDANVEVSR